MTSPAASITPPSRGLRLRILAAAVLAGAFALGPIVAWDMTSQPPRAEPRSAWPKESPWKAAGAHMKDSAKAMARVYLPARSVESAEPIPPPAAPSALAVSAPSIPTVSVTIRPMPIPRAMIAVE
jgi:hypothetical protein